MDRDQALFRLFGKFCPEGTILYTEGSAGRDLFVVQSGAVRVGGPRLGSDPEETLGPGDLLGEGALLSSPRRSKRAEVVCDARLIQVNEHNLDGVVRHGPQIARQIFEKLVKRAGESRGALRVRTCARLLRRVGPRLLETAGAGARPADLAEHAGLAEPEVLLVLEELRGRSSLVREAERYRAPDREVLRREIDAMVAAGEHP